MGEVDFGTNIAELGGNIAASVAQADDDDSLAGEIFRFFEGDRMDDFALELVNALELWHNGSTLGACGDQDSAKLLSDELALFVLERESPEVRVLGSLKAMGCETESAVWKEIKSLCVEVDVVCNKGGFGIVVDTVVGPGEVGK